MRGPQVDEDHVALVLARLAGRDARYPITKAGLAAWTGLPVRTVEATIETIRREGLALVASGPDGYWTPATLAEAEANVERRHRRAITQMTTLQGERGLIRRLRDAEALTLFGSAS
jgi:hypothetical protein